MNNIEVPTAVVPIRLLADVYELLSEHEDDSRMMREIEKILNNHNWGRNDIAVSKQQEGDDE